MKISRAGILGARRIVGEVTVDSPSTRGGDFDVEVPLSLAWHRAINDFVTYLRAAGRPATTVRLRRQHLTQLQRAVAPTGPWDVGHDQILTWFGDQTWARDTRHSVRSSIRSFYAWAEEAGHVEVSPGWRLPSIPRRPPRPKPTPDTIYTETLGRVAPRERLAIRLCAEAGLRRGEVVVVHRRDLEHTLLGVVAGELLYGWTLTVHGKGERERLVPLNDDLALELLERCGDGFAFPGQIDGHMSPLWMGQMISAAFPAGWTMHSLRHRFATRAYAVDRDLLTVQELLGHASPETTRRYVQNDSARLRRTVAAIA